MESKILVAYHNEYPKPFSDNLIPRQVCESSKYLSELSLVKDIVYTPEFNDTDYIGLVHYRRMFQTESFKEFYKSVDSSEKGFEYGKTSRPTLKFSDTNYKMMTSNYNLDLDGNDLMVLEPFVKSSTKPLESLVDLGWLDGRSVDIFYRLCSTLFEREWSVIESYMTEQKEHYCNNIIFGKTRDVRIVYYTIFDILMVFWNKLERDHPSGLTPRCLGYFGEYIMRPIIESYKFNVKTEKSICLVQ